MAKNPQTKILLGNPVCFTHQNINPSPFPKPFIIIAKQNSQLRVRGCGERGQTKKI